MQYYCSLYSKFYFSSGLCYIDALARDAYKCTRKKSLSKERKRKIATKHCWMQETTTWPKEIEIKPNIKFRNKKGTNLDSGVWSSRADDVEEEIPDCTPALKLFQCPLIQTQTFFILTWKQLDYVWTIICFSIGSNISRNISCRYIFLNINSLPLHNTCIFIVNLH